jgi:hypothetical protein
MPWGERKRYVYQNHAVSICERAKSGFIGEEEAHYVCAILNAPVVEEFIYASSDERSFKIRPPVHVAPYELSRHEHRELARLSRLAHENPDQVEKLRRRIDELYLRICRADAPTG